MKKVFNLVPPDYTEKYANASYHGTFVKRPPCPKCKAGRGERVPPLIIEWEPGSDHMGDFTWPAVLGEIVITERVRQCIASHKFRGCHFDAVEMIQDKKLRKSERATTRAQRRIWLPYEGPPLWSLEVSSWCHLDSIKSRREVLHECEVCHRQDVNMTQGAALIVDEATWDGGDFFRIREIGGVVFIREKVKRVFEKENFTNVIAEERGFID